VACWVVSLGKPPPQPMHPDAQVLLESGRVIYHDWPGRGAKAAVLARSALRHPVRAMRGWRRTRLNPDAAWREFNAAVLARRFQALRIDRIHAHFATWPAQYALAVHRWSGLPFTVTAHGSDVFVGPPSNFPELAEEADAIICVSEFNRRYIAETFGVPLERLAVIRCGIRTDVFRPGDARAASPSGPLRLLCVARLHEIKGHRYLIEAVAGLRRGGVNVDLTLVGDGPERESLERQCRDLGLTDAVHVLGFRARDDVLALYRACDVVVLPSLSEGMPIVLMEAMACGKPVVATAVRGVPELVEEKVTGLLCPPADPEALARAVTWVLDHPDEAKAIARRARERVVGEFDRATCTRHLLDLWEGNEWRA